MAARVGLTISTPARSPKVGGSNLRTRRTLLCPVCGVPTLHRFCVRKNGCDVLACSACGVGRADTTKFGPAAYYTDAYFKGCQADGYVDYAGSETVLRREFKATVEYLSRFVPRGRLLEIGCAYGFFLLEARRRFDVSGLEIAESAVRSCHGRGLTDVRHGVLGEETVRPRHRLSWRSGNHLATHMRRATSALRGHRRHDLSGAWMTGMWPRP